MNRTRLLLAFGLLFIVLLLGSSAGLWWYLFGANKVEAAELVPGDTVLFATIPNAAAIAAGYQSSQIKTLVDSADSKPLIDSIQKLVGQKNLDVLASFAPNLSGQSFFALTHFDAEHPEKTGFIAGLHPKTGLGDFDGFVAKIKTTWPDLFKSTTTGKGSIDGVDYQWMQGPGTTEKLCVTQVSGWIITTWGEAPLKDWIERFNKRASTPSLASNDDYKKSIDRVGKDPLTLFYLNYHAAMDLLEKQMSKTNPSTADYFAKKFAAAGGIAVGTHFENGEIVDRLSFLMPKQAILDAGMGAATPCAFDTLKFTSSETRFYWANNVNWQTYWKNLQEQSGQSPSINPSQDYAIRALQTWAQGQALDFQQNILGPLGQEISIQMEWGADTTYPELGFFVKLDKPDDFKPTIRAIIETARQAFKSTATVKELNSNGQNFAALKFFQASPVSPTITEDGPYLGIFTSESFAVRSFTRGDSTTLSGTPNFNRQIGNKRNGAAQIIYLDSPQLLDRAYKTALPYLSLASMFNKDLAAFLKDKTMPDNLAWLSPIGTWSCVMTPDDAGMQAYSISGIGNQGILFAGMLGGSVSVAQSLGWFPKAPASRTTALAPTPVPGTGAVFHPSPPITSDQLSQPAPSTTPAPATPDASTNAAPVIAPVPDTTTNAAPAAPTTETNSPPTEMSTPTPSAPATDSSATTNTTPSTPDATKTQ